MYIKLFFFLTTVPLTTNPTIRGLNSYDSVQKLYLAAADKCLRIDPDLHQ